ncbi:FAD-dependent oxidoreductase [Spongiibacter nanhainus]|uniref:FAD-dependent oxidoreductase n=1 Tax=Spongiibacter nanhainus TaxID=2794344 RepID=A0A7T4R3S9_9GAMM|nr:FAD-dependent oxidoreductase [Spongiibacter nanhainus]QQD19960.1 FAD-dependent oxidoreductase [Spongiibacter nanhainus]
MEHDYEVIVIGGGGAGLSAACAAAELGASVALLEAGTTVGGSTALSGGVFYAAGTTLQRQAGIENDTADDMYEYYMTLNQHRVNAQNVRKLCNASADAFEWLVECGVEFKPEGLYKSGIESVPRGHSPAAAGAGITQALEVRARNLGVDIALQSRVKRLHMINGVVNGIQLDDGGIVTSAAVVIATGGFGHNKYLLNKYYPEAASQGDWAWCISANTCVGDGLEMGLDVGADLDGYNRGLLLPTPGFYRNLDVMLPSWLMLVNREGRRFVCENIEYAVMSGVISSQLGGSAFAIFDEDSKKNGKPDPQFAAYYDSGFLTFNWSDDRIEEQLTTGKVVKADTIAELAEIVGILPRALENTVCEYNASVEAGADAQFNKTPELMRKVARPPFYACEIKPAIVCLTSAGLRMNENAEVLDKFGDVIKGLYAAGEVTGSVLGERYIGGGNSICNAVVFGRIAGEHAVSACRSNNN